MSTKRNSISINLLASQIIYIKMSEIKEIHFKQTFEVRHPVLRGGKPIETCFFIGDELKTTNHFGLFIDTKLVGVLSVYKNKNSNFNAVNPFQIRGMAVLPAFQKKGIGELLVLHCEKHVAEKRGDLIWFNARELAVIFYQKLNYLKLGDPFVIADVGIHYIMYKKLV